MTPFIQTANGTMPTPAPTPDYGTFYECPSCGWTTGTAGVSLDSEEDRDFLEQWEEDVRLHAAQCAELLHPLDQGTVSIPIVVYRERHPHAGVPGLIVRCPECKTSYWFERSKHGSKMLLEAIDDHIGHTRVAR